MRLKRCPQAIPAPGLRAPTAAGRDDWDAAHAGRAGLVPFAARGTLCVAPCSVRGNSRREAACSGPGQRGFSACASRSCWCTTIVLLRRTSRSRGSLSGISCRIVRNTRASGSARDRPRLIALHAPRDRTSSNVRNGPGDEHRPRHQDHRNHQRRLASGCQPADLIPQHSCQPSRQRKQGRVVDGVHASHLRSTLAPPTAYEFIMTTIPSHTTGRAELIIPKRMHRAAAPSACNRQPSPERPATTTYREGGVGVG